MHKLIEYACDELEKLEKKAAKTDNLSAAEVEYAAKLAELKKNLLKGEAMYAEMEEDGYSGEGGMNRTTTRMGNRGGNSNRGGSYNYGGMSYARGRGRNAKRDSMGRYSSEYGYSRAAEDMASQLREMAQDAPDDQTRMDIERLAQRMESMM